MDEQILIYAAILVAVIVLTIVGRVGQHPYGCFPP